MSHDASLVLLGGIIGLASAIIGTLVHHWLSLRREYWKEEAEWRAQRREMLRRRLEPGLESVNGSRNTNNAGGNRGLYRTLVETAGSRELANRLIEYERRKTPTEPRSVLIARALSKLQNDDPHREPLPILQRLEELRTR